MKEKKAFRLTNEDIQQTTEYIQSKMTEAGQPRKEVLRIGLLMEECLLNAQSYFGVDKKAVIEQITRFNRTTFTINIQGDAYNPLEEQNETSAQMMLFMMAGQEMIPMWKYLSGTNRISFSFRKKKEELNSVVILISSIILAVLCGLLVKTLPDNISGFIVNDITVPLFNKFIGVINAIAGPLVFLSVMWGIFSVGDTASLSRVGKKMIGRFVVMMFLMTGLCMVLLLPLYPMSSSGESSFVFSELFNMVLNIIPENAIRPFSDGNPLQIIFLAAVLGIAALIMLEKSPVFVDLIEEANGIIQLIMATITKVIPAFIFLSIFNLMMGDNLNILLNTWEPILTSTGCSIVVLSIYTVIVSVHQKISPVLLWKKLSSTFIVGITTASSSASFNSDLETCENDLGIDTTLANIGVPLGQVIFMLGVSTTLVSVGLYLGKMYEIPITVSWLSILLISSVILAIASPPMPGGVLIVYSVLLIQLGIPAEALTICTALNVVFDFLDTGANISALQMELIEQGAALNLLDKNVLLKEKEKKKQKQKQQTEQK